MKAIITSCCFTFIVCACLADDEKYTSENKANGIRPPASNYFVSMPSRTKTPDKEVFSADDVKKIEEQKDKEISVKGTVNEVFIPKSGTIVIFNFGKDRKKCFKAVIFKGDFDKWDGGSEAIKKKYQGKTITVEGKVSIHENLPQIVVKTPSQIKIN